MVRIAVIAAGAIALAGCANNLTGSDNSECVRAGYSPGSYGYTACKQSLKEQRLHQAAPDETSQ